MQNYHLTPSGNQWTLTKEGSDNPLGVFDTKEEALTSSTEFMNDRHGSLKIHKSDGVIEEERTYPRSADPVVTPG